MGARATLRLDWSRSLVEALPLLADVSSSFDRVRFVLVAPSHPGNVGAAARALKTMGFRRLVVVQPRDHRYRQHPEAVALATGAADVLAASAECATLTAALVGAQTAYALTGYDRQFGPPLMDLRSCAVDAAASMNEVADAEIAFVFGTERAGLTNEDVERCQACCAIPADPSFASLNLAQAVQVTAYEMQLALRGTEAIRPEQRRFAPGEAPATVEAVEQFYAHLEQALIATGYLDPAEPKTLLPRLRRLFNRARPTQTELDVLRGMMAAIIESRADRAGRKKIGQRG
jgi:tRNA/rRNA methyltransferase